MYAISLTKSVGYNIVSMVEDLRFIQVLCNLCVDSISVNPDSNLLEYTPLIGIQDADISVDRIVPLYEDTCGNRSDKFILLLRAHQLGLIDNSMFDDNPDVDWEDLNKLVIDETPNFKPLSEYIRRNTDGK